MGWLKNYRWLKSYQNAQFPKKDHAKVAATKAEIKAMRYIKRLDNVLEVYHATRLQHASGGNSRREVDLIAILNDRIILIEVKNYSGEISMDKNGFLHENGKNRNWSFSKLNDAATRLATSLMTVGINLGQAEIHSLLYLAGSGKKDNTVTVGNNLTKTFIADSNTSLKIAINSPLGTNGKMSKKKITAIKRFFEMCGTWDEIEYLNESLIEGDMIDATIPNDWRTNYQSVKFENLRGPIGTIFLGPKFSASAKGWKDEHAEFEINHETTIEIRTPGGNFQNISELITKLKGINFGYKELHNWTEIKLLDEPIDTIKTPNEFKKGQVIENATISDIHEDLGVFIKLNATQDGLFHKNQIPPFIWAQREGIYRPGAQVNVKITNVNKKKRKTNISVEIID